MINSHSNWSVNKQMVLSIYQKAVTGFSFHVPNKYLRDTSQLNPFLQRGYLADDILKDTNQLSKSSNQILVSYNSTA